jgi:hypothetical protein
MERLFTPCNQLHDILDSQGRLERLRHPQELNLNVSTEELLSLERAFTYYADVYAMLGNRDTLAWLTPHAAVARGGGLAMKAWNQLDNRCHFHFKADDGEYIRSLARSTEHLLEIVDVVLRLLAVSAVHSLILRRWSYRDGAWINASTLAYLLEQCQSLNALALKYLEMNEDHCRSLGTHPRPDLEIVLFNCKISDAGARALAEVLGRNQGPTKLDNCEIDNLVLANGLRGNSRMKSFMPRLSNRLGVKNQELLAYTRALPENRGLV